MGYMILQKLDTISYVLRRTVRIKPLRLGGFPKQEAHPPAQKQSRIEPHPKLSSKQSENIS